MIRALVKKDLIHDLHQVVGLLALAFVVSFADRILGHRLEYFGAGTSASLVKLGLVLFATAFVINPNEVFHSFPPKPYHRFLEFLPVRRSHVWVAEYVYGLPWLVLIVLAVFWRDLVFFSSGEGGAPMWRAPSPWTLALMLLAFFFCIYSAVSLFAWFHQFKLTNHLILLLPPAVLFGSQMLRVGAQYELHPGYQATPYFFIFGLIFAAGSFGLAVLPPRRMPHWRQFLFFGIPVFICIAVLTNICLSWFCGRWKEIDPDGELGIKGPVHLVNPGGKPVLVTQVVSRRSGEHAFSVNVDTRRSYHLGRGLVPVGRQGLGANPDRLAFISNRAEDGLRRDRDYLVTMNPDGTGKRRIFLIQEHQLEGKGFPEEMANLPDATVRRYDFQWYPPADLFLYRERFDYSSNLEDLVALERIPADMPESYLVIADRHGREKKRFAVADSRLSDEGYVLGILPPERNDSGEPSWGGEPYVLINLATFETARFGLPGILADFSDDSHRAICVRTRFGDGREYYSVVLVEIPSLAERILISEDELPSVEVREPRTRDLWPSLVSDIRTDDLPMTLRADPTFTWTLWIRKELREDEFRYSVMLVDIRSGEKTVLIPESELPSLPAFDVEPRSYQRDPPITLYRLPSEEDPVIYGVDGKVFRRDPRDGRAVLLAEWSEKDSKDDVAYETEPRFSPDKRRLFTVRTLYRVLHQWQREFVSTSIQLHDGAESKTLYSTEDQHLEAFWVDENRIAFWGSKGIFLINADGTGLEQIFPARVPG